MEETLKLATITATIGLTVGWFIVQLYPEPIVSMFNSDAKLVSISVDGIRKYLSMVHGVLGKVIILMNIVINVEITLFI